MSNRRELRDARRKAEEAAWILSAVESLPRRVGQMVKWSTGVVWRRVGDDEWELDRAPECGHCYEDYPCPTVQAIQAALAVNDEGGK